MYNIFKRSIMQHRMPFLSIGINRRRVKISGLPDNVRGQSALKFSIQIRRKFRRGSNLRAKVAHTFFLAFSQSDWISYSRYSSFLSSCHHICGIWLIVGNSRSKSMRARRSLPLARKADSLVFIYGIPRKRPLFRIELFIFRRL